MKRRWLRGLLIAAGLCLTLLAMVAVLANHYAWAARTEEALVLTTYRTIDFAAMVRGRDAQCALADVWRESAPRNSMENVAKIEEKMRELQRDGDLEQVQTPSGRFWIPASDRAAVAEIFSEQDEDEYGAAQSIRPGDVVLDCGAHVGTFTRVALNRGAGRVVSIDPAPWAAECLRRNFAEEIRNGRVVVVPKGVWDRDDTLTLDVPPGMATTAGTVALRERAGTTIKVQLTTIDHLVTELGLQRVDLIKMDIEGAELNALRGSVQSIERFHPSLSISLEHRPTDLKDIPALARRLWPSYKYECGSCAKLDGRIRPSVMFGRPPGQTASR